MIVNIIHSKKYISPNCFREIITIPLLRVHRWNLDQDRAAATVDDRHGSRAEGQVRRSTATILRTGCPASRYARLPVRSTARQA